jgi:hypothetical protein
MGYGGTILIPRSPHGEIILTNLFKMAVGLGMKFEARDQLRDVCEHDDEPSGSVKGGECLD